MVVCVERMILNESDINLTSLQSHDRGSYRTSTYWQMSDAHPSVSALLSRRQQRPLCGGQCRQEGPPRLRFVPQILVPDLDLD